MQNCECERCGTHEIIPTHQFVKFDLQVNYLCGSCWEEFRRWFNVGRRKGEEFERAA